MVISWAAVAYGRLQVKYLGTIFQIYPKGLPEIGDCTRFEGHYNTKEDKKLKDMIPDIINGDRNGNRDIRLPFVTAE